MLPTSPPCALTPSSTPRIRRCSVAAASMARSIVRAGPELLAECRTLNGCATGDAKITRGYRLPAKHVIHAVGPVWHGGREREDELLASCYRRALELCQANALSSLAYPAISTGVYRFPADRAAGIAVATVADALARRPTSPRSSSAVSPPTAPGCMKRRWRPSAALVPTERRPLHSPGEVRGGV